DFGATHRIGVSFRFGERIQQLNKEERAILKEANGFKSHGNYVQAILGYNEILDRNPENDHILHVMIDTHEKMLQRELSEAVAQTMPPSVPYPEEAALSDLV